MMSSDRNSEHYYTNPTPIRYALFNMNIEVQAGEHDRHWCPISVKTNGEKVDEIRYLRELSTGVIVPAQPWTSGTGKPMLSWIIPTLAARTGTTYETIASGDPIVEDRGTDQGGVRIVAGREGELDIFVHNELLTTYRFGPDVVRPYFYPLFAADGTGITRNWPMVEGVARETADHPHHKGLYTAHGDVNGVDDWSEAAHHGCQIHKEFVKTFEGSVDGGFVEKLDWTDENRAVVMSETRYVNFYVFGPGIRIIDYTLVLHASNGRVVLGDTKEAGLLSVRVASSMDAGNPAGGRITNGFGGTQESETWGKPAPWCDYSGPIGNDWFGICLMDHPDNPRHPTPWHVRNYGLMTANCFGYHDFSGDPDNRHDLAIEADDEATWSYRIVMHRGTAADARLTDRYFDFAFPPSVKIAER